MTYLEKKEMQPSTLRSTLAKIVAVRNPISSEYYEQDRCYITGSKQFQFHTKMEVFDSVISILTKDIKEIEDSIMKFELQGF